jgi:hypothetical protein
MMMIIGIRVTAAAATATGSVPPPARARATQYGFQLTAWQRFISLTMTRRAPKLQVRCQWPGPARGPGHRD